jgi:hypothetical protein
MFTSNFPSSPNQAWRLALTWKNDLPHAYCTLYSPLDRNALNPCWCCSACFRPYFVGLHCFRRSDYTILFCSDYIRFVYTAGDQPWLPIRVHIRYHREILSPARILSAVQGNNDQFIAIEIGTIEAELTST